MLKKKRLMITNLNMDYQDKRTKFGCRMYLFTMKWGEWIDRVSFFYYLLMFTWGILEVIAGFFVFLFMLITGHKPHRNHRGIYFMFGNNWGGFSLGLTQVIANNMGNDWTLHTIQHECGHSYQVTYLGPLWFFFVGIPSQIRWFIDNYQIKHGLERIDYDAAWFEGSATDLGKELVR